MQQQLRHIHRLGVVSFIATIIMSVTETSILSLFGSFVATHLALFITIHYLAFLLAVSLYFILVSKIATVLQQKLLKKFGVGLLLILLGTILLLMDFGMADGAATLNRPNLPVYILIFAVFLGASFMIGIGAKKVCQIYILIAKQTDSIYFKLSWRSMVLALILFFIFLLSWMFVQAVPESKQFIIGLIGLGYSLSYELGQLFFSLGAIKFKR